MTAVRVIVRELRSGVYHRGVRVNGDPPQAFDECDVRGPLSSVPQLPPDVDWQLVHDCLRIEPIR